MIIPMVKYTFLAYHQDYERFLEDIRNIGVLDIVEKTREYGAEVREKLDQLKQAKQALQFMNKLKEEVLKKKDAEIPTGPESAETGEKLVEKVLSLRDKKEWLKLHYHHLEKQIKSQSVWGIFSVDTIKKLAENKVYIKLFVASEKKFSPEWTSQFDIFVINTISPLIYFALVTENEISPEIDAEEIKIPEESVSQLEIHQQQAKAEFSQVENELIAISVNQIEAVENYLLEIEQSIDLQKVLGNTKTAVDDHVKIVEAYAPVDETKALEEYLEKNEIAWITEKANPVDRIPIKQKNNRFAKLYEPVGKLFSLPAYTEMDLTPFFAPFFMMFFGFCLGDLGYGLVIVAGAAWYKRKAKEDLKPILSLAQFLGIGTIILGTLTGTFFGINLLEVESLGNLRKMMLDSQKVFYLSLAVGMFQIMFGMALKAVNNYRMFGWQYAMLPIGWLIMLFGIIDAALVKMMPGINMFIIYAGIGVIIIFSDPASGIFGRIGKGIWELYGISGIFGDVLSYVRLFALGISGAILGFVVNTIALQIKDSYPIIGPIFFVIFLIVGHGANLLISSLGAFVHPMRLTFVEFYKNAGFAGGGKEYTPFRNKLIN